MHVIFCSRKGSNNIIMDQVKLSVRRGKVSCGCNSVPVHLWLLALDEWSAYLRISALILCQNVAWSDALLSGLNAWVWQCKVLNTWCHRSGAPWITLSVLGGNYAGQSLEGNSGGGSLWKGSEGWRYHVPFENSLLVCSPFLSFVSVVCGMMRCWKGQRNWRLWHQSRYSFVCCPKSSEL